MTLTGATRRLFAVLAGLALASVLLAEPVGNAARAGQSDSTPIGPLPQGPVTSTTTRPGLLVAVALPHASRTSGLVWRVARAYDAGVVRQISEADVGSSVVLVFKVVGRGNTRLVFALTRGDASSKAVKSATHKVHSV